MADLATHFWIGASGKQYKYYVCDLNFDFSPNQNGNYIFCKIEKGAWVPVYVGEGDLKDRVAFRKNDRSVGYKNATHIHAHQNNNETDRKNEESDILARHSEAYDPTGCNIKEGG